MTAGVRTLLESLSDGQTSAERIVRAALERAQDDRGELHAFVSVGVESAIASARALDVRRRNGKRLPLLAGVPWAVKDIVDVAGCVTRAGSRTTKDRAPAAADAAIVAEIADLGAVLVGKTSTNELAYGGPSWDVDFPVALNPACRGRYTGGSSSGSAAAVSAGIVPFAIGTDTGGSVRGPAAWTGCVGVKPTMGALPSTGVMALAGSLDHVGILTRTVDDADIVWSALCGERHDRPVSPTLAGYRIGFLAEDWVGPDVEEAVRDVLDHAARLVDALGAELVDVEMPDFAGFSAAGRVLFMAEAWETHAAAIRHRPNSLGEATRGRLLLGATISPADKAIASRARRRLATAT
ncbi:MAG: amidase, partial [Ilumatobacteraceae bacterium]